MWHIVVNACSILRISMVVVLHTCIRVSFKLVHIHWASKEISKNHIICSLRTATKGHLFRTFNSYSFNFNGRLWNRQLTFNHGELRARKSSSFCDLKKVPLVISPHFFLLFDWSKSWCFKMCWIRITIANLCTNVIHFDALDLSVALKTS